jgi:murein DD-endopeptidase MepM/ murein hydrolase activator NlpD
VVEKCFVRGKYVGYGHILAADFVVRKTHHKAFFFNENGKGGYFDENARALERGFLRVPLSYSRISSRYTNSRRHPVTGNVRAHYGVDYAAPRGTPVMATASGTITKMTYNKSSGNYVEIRHANSYHTFYLHLSKFNSRLKTGSPVIQGQIIGYVGSTGLSTGPHLDYRIKHRNSWLNPLTFIAESPKMNEDSVEAYTAYMEKYASTLEIPHKYAGSFKLQPMP